MSMREDEGRPVERFDEAQIARLRQAFHVDSDRPDPEACPPPGRILDAVRGDTSADEVRAVLDHLADCPACSEEWRLGVAFEEEAEEQAEPAARPERGAPGAGGGRVSRLPSAFPAWVAAAAAVLLALGVAGIWWSQQRGVDPGGDELPPAEYRQGDEAAGERIESLVPEGEPLPKAEPVLRWTPVPEDSPEGSVYSIVVSTEDVTAAPVAEASGLEEPRYRIPDDALEDLPSGTTLLWSVEATTAGGRRVTSPTFTTAID